MSNIIATHSSLLEALRQLNELSGGVMTLLVTDSDDRLCGTLTDGDIRRHLLAGGTTADRVDTAMHRDCTSVTADSLPLTAAETAGLLKKGISLVPVVDDERHIVDIIDIKNSVKALPLSALIMAGGKGERLMPLTADTPKPLIDVGGQPIIDYTVAQLRAAGISDITVSTLYHADKLKAHFSKDSGTPAVRCIDEPEPLGTIGALGYLLPLPFDNIVVTNSDLLTTISYGEMYKRHTTAGADITVATIPYTHDVPYAILDIDGDRIKGIEEKPTYTHYANAGTYIISRVAAALITPGEHIDAPDLIKRALSNNLKVTYFINDGLWIDVGTHAQLAHARNIMKNIYG